MQIYSLIYAERENSSSAASAIVGPKLFFSYDKAVETVLRYVRGRVVDCGMAFDFFDGIDGIDGGLDDADLAENVITEDSFDQFVAAMSPDDKVQLIDRYFNFASDEVMDSFYTITQHETSVLEDFASHLGVKIDEAIDTGGDVGMFMSDDNLSVLAHAFDAGDSSFYNEI